MVKEKKLAFFNAISILNNFHAKDTFTRFSKLQIMYLKFFYISAHIWLTGQKPWSYSSLKQQFPFYHDILKITNNEPFRGLAVLFFKLIILHIWLILSLFLLFLNYWLITNFLTVFIYLDELIKKFAQCRKVHPITFLNSALKSSKKKILQLLFPSSKIVFRLIFSKFYFFIKSVSPPCYLKR